MTRSTGARLALGLVVAVAMATVVLGTGSTASATGENAGSVQVRDQGGGSALGSGKGSTEFTLQLPDGASCQGDSLNDDYRVQSFMIPAGDDPGALEFENLKPAGNGRYALYSATTSPYRQALTAPNDEPGKPGLITELPTFSFAALEGSPVEGGSYTIGIACSLDNQATRYWSTAMVVTRSTSSAGVSQFSWTASDNGASSSSSSSSSTSRFLLIAGIAVVVIVAVVLLVRRSRSPQSSPKES